MWKYLKILFLITYLYSSIFFSNLLYNLFNFKKFKRTKKNNSKPSLTNLNKKEDLSLLIGENANTRELIYLPEKSLYQNILITGTIGTGKTSSAMYPFTKQLIKYKNCNKEKKLGMLILDVKGNYYKKVLEFASDFNRLDNSVIQGTSKPIFFRVSILLKTSLGVPSSNFLPFSITITLSASTASSIK